AGECRAASWSAAALCRFGLVSRELGYARISNGIWAISRKNRPVLARLFRRSLLQQRSDHFPDIGSDNFDGASGIDDFDAFRIGGGNGLIAFFDALEELAAGFFHAVAQRRIEREWHGSGVGRACCGRGEEDRLAFEPAGFADIEW